MGKKSERAKPSFTAFLIPKLLPALAHNKKYSSLLTSEQIDISRRFAREAARSDFGISLIHKIPRKQALWLANNMGIKGLPVHYAARKKYIRDKFEQVAGDVSQVVVLGAGFDTLCLELHRAYPQTKFFEIDMPATQSVKLAALKKMPGVLAGDNLKFIPSDLSREVLSEVLERNGFDKTAKSFFVIEGVLMYLEKADIEKLFADIGNITGSGSYAVFGSMSDLSNENDMRAKFSDAALAKRKEKYKFSATPDDIKLMMASKGFALLDHKLYHELQEGYESTEQIEALSKERGEHYYFATRL